MSYLRAKRLVNGDHFTDISLYICDRCSVEFDESDPHTPVEGSQHYCWDCSFILNYIDSRKYLDYVGMSFDKINAAVKDGKIVVWMGKRAPWEQTAQDVRNSQEYVEWRKQVYERDGYTCRQCSQVGGKLNAHHIKPFAKYKELRFEVSNGLTLCIECHREIHKKKR